MRNKSRSVHNKEKDNILHVALKSCTRIMDYLNVLKVFLKYWEKNIKKMTDRRSAKGSTTGIRDRELLTQEPNMLSVSLLGSPHK